MHLTPTSPTTPFAFGLLLATMLGPLAAFEAATISLVQPSKASWTEITFEKAFPETPAVVMGPLSYNGTDPATVRIRNVSTKGFQFQIDEWDYRDGSHIEESLSYLAAQPGQSDLEGAPIVAGTLQDVAGTLQAFKFETAFKAPPVILFQVEANDSSPALVVRPRRITTTGFELRIQAEEKNRSRLKPHTIHFIAFEPGQYLQPNGQPILVASSPDKVTHAWHRLEFPTSYSEPVFLAHMQTTGGGDTAALRHRNLESTGVQIRIEEEQSRDQEVWHTTEKVGYIVFGRVIDQDQDGIPDAWEEAYGLSPMDATDATADNDGDGRTNKQEFDQGSDPHQFDGIIDGGIIRLVADNPRAYERELLNASFRIRRAQSNAPISVQLIITPNSNPTKSNASPDDYQLLDSSGLPLQDSVLFEAGQRTMDVLVAPVRDSVSEVPETLRIRVAPSDQYQLSDEDTVDITLYDATNTPENERLYVATLRSEGMANTSAAGLSTIRLQGDNSFGLVNLDFEGLSSPQTAVHIHIANPISGPPLESLNLGSVHDHQWNIRATQFLTTDQSVLDALKEGRLYVNVHSANYPAGEIRGDYRQQTGSVDFQAPESPPELEDLSPEELERDIARFLMQSSFGPTAQSVTEVSRHITQSNDRIEGIAQWIEEQMDAQQTPPISLLSLTKASDRHEASFYDQGDYRIRSHNLRHSWWTMAMKGSDQLRQRVAFALSQIFVISTKDSLINNRHYGAAHFYDTLSRGAFGSYRDLLENVTKHPIMGHYLSHLRNQKDILDADGNTLVSPDENFAREIMQLFSIGLVERHPDGTIVLDSQGLPIPTYGQTQITELARVMTGLSFSKRNIPRNSDTVRENTRFNYGNGSRGYQDQWIHPMKFFENFHDQDRKRLINGNQTPPNQGGEKDLDAALDAIASHPNTAPFVSRLLIQRLVTSNPTRGYIYRVAQVFNQSAGQLGEVIKAILLDPEARNLAWAGRVDAGKQKEPIIRYLALYRALAVESKLPLSALTQHGYPRSELSKFPRGSSMYRMGNTDTRLAQTPQGAPTVFNWFLPDFTVSGPLAEAGLVAPEFQVTTESQVVNAVNSHYTILFNRNGQGGLRLPEQNSATDDNMIPNLAAFTALIEHAEANNATALEVATLLVDFTDLLLSGGNLKAVYQNQIGKTPRDIMIEAVATSSRNNKIKTALYLYVTSPEYVTLK